MDKPSFWVAGAIFFAFAFWFTGYPATTTDCISGVVRTLLRSQKGSDAA